ncbi:hypothetical protein Tco_0669192 [Tanacetum coccineum]
MGNRIRTRNPDILLRMILQFEFLSKCVMKRRQNARMSSTHLHSSLGELHEPSAIIFVEEVMVDARHGPMGFSPNLHNSSGLLTSYSVGTGILIQSDISCTFAMRLMTLPLSIPLKVIFRGRFSHSSNFHQTFPEYKNKRSIGCALMEENTENRKSNTKNLGCYCIRKFDTSYPTGGYAVSGVLPE